MSQPIFCAPYSPKRDLVKGLRRDLRAAGPFRARENFLVPAETSRSPRVSVSARLDILRRVYRGDYHTDSYALERLADCVARGDELIWFWGESGEVAKLRAAMRSRSGRLSRLKLGTVSVIDSSQEFGDGSGELCRSGSMDRRLGAKVSSLWRVLSYMTGTDSAVCDRYHSLLLVPRVRRSSPGIRGGEAVNAIHRRYVQSRFWGFAPWYVMQGGVLEVLELRECNRDPGDVRRAVLRSAPWIFADEGESRFATALCEISLGARPSLASAVVRAVPRFRAGLFFPSGRELRRFNPAFLRATGRADSGGAPFDEKCRELTRAGAACSAVRLRLDEPRQAVAQIWLRRRGFRLTAIVPPKTTWVARDGRRRSVQTPPYGFWCRPRPGLKLELPFYVGESGGTQQERDVLIHLRGCLEAWRSA